MASLPLMSLAVLAGFRTGAPHWQVWWAAHVAPRSSRMLLHSLSCHSDAGLTVLPLIVLAPRSSGNSVKILVEAGEAWHSLMNIFVLSMTRFASFTLSNVLP